jgi:hypothetical protein
MKRSLARATAIGLLVLLGMAMTPPPARAVKEFFAEFEAKYAKRNTRKRNEIALTKAIDQAKCTICHPNNNKHKLTSYGSEVAKRINQYDKQNKKKIQEALENVSKLPNDSYDPKSPKFGAIFKQGKLPKDYVAQPAQ